MIIGICGKSGSGKSTLARLLIEKDVKKYIHLDIDKIGHKVLLINEVKNQLISSFGTSILKKNEIDRKALSKIVFDSKDAMQKLTDITWNYMQVEIDNFIEENNEKSIILDWQLLPISKYFNMCDKKILLDISYEVRKERVIKRDNITKEAFDLREKASIDFSKYTFDYIIRDDESGLRELVEEL